jgi:glutamate 5-kinase
VQSRKDYKRIVIKVGSSLFASEKVIDAIIKEVSDLVKNEQKEIVIVSSGAIAYGMSILGLKSRPSEVSELQATAAIGQTELMNVYRRGLEKQGIKCAQVLLTWDDFNERARYLNARNTLLELIKIRSVSIVNENDTVSTEEIRFGDNDQLSARLYILIEADLLIILSDIDGLLRKGERIQKVDKITSEIKKIACPTDKETCVGGMITKLEAAKMVTDSGIHSGIQCVIDNGTKENIIRNILNMLETYQNDPRAAVLTTGTSFTTEMVRVPARKSWIVFGTKPKGKIYVDDGAKQALVKNFKSLLSPGVTKLEGNFDVGDIVLILDDKGKEFARGITNYSSDELSQRKGKRSEREVIHRDNLHIKE